MVGAMNLPSPYKGLIKFRDLRNRIFAQLRQTTFKIGKFTRFKVLFLVVSMYIR